MTKWAWLCAFTGSLYGGGHAIELLKLKDNFGWGGGGIQSMNFKAVGPGYQAGSTRHAYEYNCPIRN